MGTHNQRLGRRGEDAATDWYVAAGYQILDRNWRCKQGELDLVVGCDAMVVFVEVKARSSSRYGSGFEAVNRAKQLRVRRLAASWLTTHRFVSDIRFDVVDVDGRGNVRVRQGCF